MLKRVLIRCADGAMIALLVLGSSDARTFVAVVCGLMAFVAFISWFVTLTDEQAERLGGKTLVGRVIGWGFTVGYVSGLIYASYPILAALYFFAILGLRAKVADTRKKAQSNEIN